jgi:hypothetical protein
VEELQLALTTARVDQRNFGLWINNWQVGQTLNALVSQQLPGGDLVLRVGAQQITATSDIPIQPGTQLLLEVKQLRPAPTLRILSPQVTPMNSESVGGTLRLLPGLAPGLASGSLGAAMQAASDAGARLPLPPALADSLSDLLRLSSRSTALTRPEGVAAAVRQSGLFLEAGMAAAPGAVASPASDLKAGLLRTLARIDAALSQAQALSLPGADAEALLALRQELERGLGRIVLQQLASQPAEGQAGRSWQLDIPVQLGTQFHDLRLTIEEQCDDGGAAAAEEEGGWRVRLQFDLPALGAMDLRLHLRGEQLDLRLAAARESTRMLLESGLPRLVDALGARGLRVNAAQTATLVAEATAPREEPGRGRGLDVQA